MSDEGAFAQGSDDVTRRTKLIHDVEGRAYDLETRALRAEDAIRRIKFWVQTALGIATAVAVATFAIARWMGNVAHTQELGEVSTRVTVIETKVDMIIKQLEVTSQQSKEIARAVKAPMVLQPDEMKLTAPAHPAEVIKR